ncbi:MAG: M48 family metalloprotease [Geobacter sp.]|nr:M48 family metalloprotease [Geobacter sp.]
MDSKVFIKNRLQNLFQSIILLLLMVGLVLVLAWFFAGGYGIIWSLVLLVPLAVGSRHAPLIVLKMYRAQPVSLEQAPQLFAIAGELAGRAGLREPPQLHYMANDSPLIFSIGYGENGSIVISDGVLRLLTLRELIGVMAHEICHIASRDTRVMGIADMASHLASIISMAGQLLILINLPLYLLGQFSLPWFPIFLMAVAPLASTLLQLALSRTREYDADLLAARLTGDPQGLAAALAKLETRNEQIARQFFQPGAGTAAPSLLRTHPDTGKRVKRLLELDAGHAEPFLFGRDDEGNPIPVSIKPPRTPGRRWFDRFRR